MMARTILAGLTAGILTLLIPAIATADEHEVSFAWVGPADLSGHGDTPNAGEHVELATIDLETDDVWTVTSTVRLFVPDPGPDDPETSFVGFWKNSQGCALIANGGQIGGAGGSSALWTMTEDGKEVVFTEWWNGAEFLPSVEVQGPATVSLECFIDASHSSVTEADREGMVATDIELHAVRDVPEPEPEACPFDSALLESDPECEEQEAPDPDPVKTSDPEPTSTSTATPVAATSDTLPKTGYDHVVAALFGGALVIFGFLTARRFSR